MKSEKQVRKQMTEENTRVHDKSLDWHVRARALYRRNALRWVIEESEVELDGATDGTDGSVVADDVDTDAQCEIINAAQYLDADGIRDMIEYLKSL